MVQEHLSLALNPPLSQDLWLRLVCAQQNNVEAVSTFDGGVVEADNLRGLRSTCSCAPRTSRRRRWTHQQKFGLVVPRWIPMKQGRRIIMCQTIGAHRCRMPYCKHPNVWALLKATAANRSVLEDSKDFKTTTFLPKSDGVRATLNK